MACRYGHKETVVALMDKGADIHIKDDEVGINNT
jgi:ankyrin repeat protein